MIIELAQLQFAVQLSRQEMFALRRSESDQDYTLEDYLKEEASYVVSAHHDKRSTAWVMIEAEFDSFNVRREIMLLVQNYLNFADLKEARRPNEQARHV